MDFVMARSVRFAWIALTLVLTAEHSSVIGLSFPKAPRRITLKPAKTLTRNLLRRTIPMVQQRNQTVDSSFAEWEIYEDLRSSELDREILDDFFSQRPQVIAKRLAKASTTLLSAQRKWKRSQTEDQGQSSGPLGMMAVTNLEQDDRALDLCAAVSSLGPVAVKIGQTLSQRPDIVGDDAAAALQRLQTKNLPFPNEWAYRVIRSGLNWTEAPLAPDIVDEGLANPMAKPLFAKMTEDPIACASLGQVYKGTLWDGREVAIKVQRPDAMSLLAKDMQCFRNVFQTRRRIEKLIESRKSKEQADLIESQQDVGSVIDEVGKDILKELDYTLEASNSLAFRESLEFLGFVTTPEPVPELTSERVLVTEWINGAHLSDLTVDEGLAMTRMAVEACTASLVLTGFVHSDPHEGNLMLHKDGRVVFLDFGLMSRVDQGIMEGFARGIQALLSEDWRTLTKAFLEVGFIVQPIMHRFGLEDTWRFDPRYGIDELTIEVSEAMEKTEGGMARFGSLATVLNKEISPNWLCYSPPYILLLVRTFLTLEGMAAKLDPEFNIYEMAMPWAVRRTLSPSTQEGVDVFRSTIMTPDNRVQWSRLLELTSANTDNDTNPTVMAGTQKDKEKSATRDKAKKAAMQAAVGSLLGATQGRALRRALKDVDSTDFLNQLATKDGRKLLSNALTAVLERRKKLSKTDVVKASDARPTSKECLQRLKRETRWGRRIGKFLLWVHLKKQMNIRGFLSMARLTAVMIRVATSMFLQKLNDTLRRRKLAHTQ